MGHIPDMEFDFDDGLSEDWVSQPRSSGVPSIQDEDSRIESSIGKAREHSLRTKSNSDSSARANGHRRETSGNILVDRKVSDLNILPKQPSSICGTVQIREVEKVVRSGNIIPLAQDLFSPLDLENVFTAPELPQHSPRSRNRQTKPTKFVQVDDFPSSPPSMMDKSPRSAAKRSSARTYSIANKANSSVDTEELITAKIVASRQSCHDSRRIERGSASIPIRGNRNRVESGRSDLQHEHISPIPTEGGRIVRRPSSSDPRTETHKLQSVTIQRGVGNLSSSFLQRSLSPSSENFHQDLASQRASQHYEIPIYRDSISHSQPTTPVRNRINQSCNPDRQPPRSSPLKLFDNYDTFTNERLTRRLSQYANAISHSDPNDSGLTHDEDATSPIQDKVNSKVSRRNSLFSQANPQHFGSGGFDSFKFENHEESNATSFRNAVSKFRGTHIRPQQNLGMDDVFTDYYKDCSNNSEGPTTEDDLKTKIHHESQEGDGKRARSGLIKTPYPKRQRLLSHTQQEALEHAHLSVQGQWRASISLAGQKRKDARYETKAKVADPEIIANRQMLHPRRIYSSGPLSEDCVSQANEESSKSSVRDEIAARMVQDDQRKHSVTTADFFNEANFIMQHLRAQVKTRSRSPSGRFPPHHNLGNVSEISESEIEQSKFSRPPSRDGKPVAGAKPKSVDPAVIRLLDQYRDSDTTEVFSPGPLKLQSHESESPNILDHNHQSDPPNIIIRNSCERGAKNPATDRDPISSHPSSNVSTGRSDPTGTSSGSGTRNVIVPEEVAHLLKDDIGGMTFDHARRLWVKRRSISRKKSAGSVELNSETTEADPLEDIPDLHIEEAQGAKEVKTSIEEGRPSSSGTIFMRDFQYPERESLPIQHFDRNATIETNLPGAMNFTSSAISRYSPLASSDARPETRATSWGTQVPKSSGAVIGNISTEHENVVEEEINLMEGRPIASPQRQNRQPRAVTVAFSSPIIRPSLQQHGEEHDLEADLSGLDLSESPIRQRSAQDFTPTHYYTEVSVSGTRGRNSTKLAYTRRQYSLQRIPTIEEHRATSYHQLPHLLSTEAQFGLSTPQLPRNTVPLLGVAASSMKRQSSVLFELSSISDFTIHQDKDGQVNHTEELDAQHSKEHEVYPMAEQDLVKALTDVKADELFWLDIQRLNLSRRELCDIHFLSHYCPSLTEMDLSHNSIRQLEGAPISLLALDASANALNGLSTWGHLVNLQYLDISGNELQTLDGLAPLLHLRELRVNSNKIENLDSLTKLPGLIRFSARNNQISNVSIAAGQLLHLEMLDLKGNEIGSSRGIECLTSLKSLNLGNNKLSTVTISSTTLESLDLSSNNLSTIDVSELPRLCYLKLDHNKISRIEGVADLKTLDTVSWRAQDLGTALLEETINYQELHEVRRLLLSGNRIKSFEPQFDFPNLHHLELASTGLEMIGSTVGKKLSNLRVLNLNDNALEDLRPLLGIKQLAELYLIGNRIKRLRRTVAVLKLLGTSLKVLDLRQNHVTLNFYSKSAMGLGNAFERDLVVKADTPVLQQTYEEENDLAGSAYLMPAAKLDLDMAFKEHLDEKTLLCRRVYEVLVLRDCKMLAQLDGLDVQSLRTAQDEDDIVQQLKAIGVLAPGNRE